MNKQIVDQMADLKEEGLLALVKKELEAGIGPFNILESCRKGVEAVGDRFSEGEYCVSDLMMAGEIFRQINALIAPELKGKTQSYRGKVVFGTVAGDIHNIGKDLVVGILRSVGYDVTDLGTDVPKEKFINAVRETGAPVLGLSALLTTAFNSLKDVIKGLEEAGLRKKIKVIIGGGPVTEDVRKYTGADAWGNNTQAAVEFCKKHSG